MNKALLIEAVARRLETTPRKASVIVEAVLDSMVRPVVEGERVSITGFGSLERVTRPARRARNPQTGETVRIPARYRIKFRPGRKFQDLVAGKLELTDESVIKKAPKGSKSNPAV